MSHDIEPNSEYAIVTVKLALATICGDTAADGLNELLRPVIGEGFIADYAFYNTVDPLIVKASKEPEEGELFADVGTFVVMIKRDGELAACHRVDSALALDTLTQSELMSLLAGKFFIESGDYVDVLKVDAMRRNVV